jgi:Ca2+/Na+ antiporter
MYIINSFRALALILLAAILIIKEVPFKPLFKDAMIQFYLALTCMLFLLLVDNIFGFLLSICLLSLYFRIYTSELKNKKMLGSDSSVSGVSGSECKCGDGSDSSVSECKCDANSPSDARSKCEGDKCELNMAHLDTNKHAKLAVAAVAATAAGAAGLVPYITEENLLAAQSNIVNPVEYNKELNETDKGVYGSQGLDTKNIHIKGYDTNSEHLGTLTFAIV